MRNLKKMISVMLALTILVCSAVFVEFSATAAPDVAEDVNVTEFVDDTTVPTTEYVEELTDYTVGATEPAEENTTVATEPTEATKPTSPMPTIAEPTSKKPVPKVGVVKNIQKSGASTNSITLTWNKVKGATGYYLYIKTVGVDKSYRLLGKIKTNKYTFKKLTQGSPYYFRIAAYVQQDGTDYRGETTFKRTATQPVAVGTPKLIKSTNSEIKISWARNPKATGYKIYRACSDTNGKYVLYKTIKNNKTTSLSDKNIKKNKAYNYQVQAYCTLFEGANTYHSTKTSVKSVCGLYVSDFTVKSQVWKASLTWSKNSYAAGYDIYYSTSKNSGYKKLGSTKNTYFNSKKLTHNKTYYFRVCPYKYVGKDKTKVLGSYVTKAKKITKLAYREDVGSTYIEISIKQQHMCFYVDGKLYCETDVVTGNADGYHDTPKGTYRIFSKSSPAVLSGPGYSSPVDYWMPFTYQGHGIHDASWRSSGEYGGTTYKGNGSHGCVNTPYKAVKKIYKKAKIGCEVVIY